MTWQAAAVTHDDGGLSSLVGDIFAVCTYVSALSIPCETLARVFWRVWGIEAVLANERTSDPPCSIGIGLTLIAGCDPEVGILHRAYRILLYLAFLTAWVRC